MDYIGEDNPAAAVELDEAFEALADQVRQRPELYKAGRVGGTRECVVRSNYIMVYRIADDSVEILRVLHAARRWPNTTGRGGVR